MKAVLGGDLSRWAEFKRRYFKDLAAQPDAVAELRNKSRSTTVTLIVATRDPEHNHAAVLKEHIERA